MAGLAVMGRSFVVHGSAPIYHKDRRQPRRLRRARPRHYHSPATVADKIATLRDMTAATSIMLHYPPWYGIEKTPTSLELFATEVARKLRVGSPKRIRV